MYGNDLIKLQNMSVQTVIRMPVRWAPIISLHMNGLTISSIIFKEIYQLYEYVNIIVESILVT